MRLRGPGLHGGRTQGRGDVWRSQKLFGRDGELVRWCVGPRPEGATVTYVTTPPASSAGFASPPFARDRLAISDMPDLAKAP